jgi:hypothetical protein
MSKQTQPTLGYDLAALGCLQVLRNGSLQMQKTVIRCAYCVQLWELEHLTKRRPRIHVTIRQEKRVIGRAKMNIFAVRAAELADARPAVAAAVEPLSRLARLLSGDRLRTSTARCCGWPAIMLRCDGS